MGSGSTTRRLRITPIARGALVAMLLLGALDLGCAQHCAEQTARQTREGAARAFVHRAGWQRLWRELAELLRERGWKLASGSKPRADVTLYTRWRTSSRLLVRVSSVERGRYALRIDLQYRGRDDAGAEVLTLGRRELAIEWALIERLAPKRAAQINARALRRGAVTHDACSGRGCQTCTGFRLGCGCPR